MACKLYGYDCALIAAVTGMTTVSCLVLQQLKAIHIGLQSVVMACASSDHSCTAYMYMSCKHVQMCMHNDNPDYSMYLESVISRLVMGQHQSLQLIPLFSLVASSIFPRMMLLTGKSRGLGLAVTKG